MAYFDYSATSNANDEVLNKFIEEEKKDKLSYTINDLEKEINNILNSNFKVNFTSGSTEANNLAIKGVLNNYETGHIITTKLEHSSVIEIFKYFEKKGFAIDYINIKEGMLDLDDLIKKIRSDTLLVSVCSVNSELGLINPITEIAKILKSYPNIVFHSDFTQSMGKINIPLKDIDLISFSSHKFYGLKGVGVLLQNKNLSLKPLFFGKRTYNLPLCNSLVNALNISLRSLNEKHEKIKKMHLSLRENLENYENVVINSPKDNILYSILNISIKGIKPETFLHALEKYQIYISTKSACSIRDSYSLAVYDFTKDLDLAKTSLRISISYETKEEDIKMFKQAFKNCYQSLLLEKRKD